MVNSQNILDCGLKQTYNLENYGFFNRKCVKLFDKKYNKFYNMISLTEWFTVRAL